MSEEKGAEHWLGEILAVIHGDGGDYLGEHGVEKATRDGVEIWEKQSEVLERVVRDRGLYRRALEKIGDQWAQPAKDIARDVLNEINSQEEDDMSKEKNTQKSGEGYPNTKIYGSKGSGNPTDRGGINRPTKGQG